MLAKSSPAMIISRISQREEHNQEVAHTWNLESTRENMHVLPTRRWSTTNKSFLIYSSSVCYGRYVQHWRIGACQRNIAHDQACYENNTDLPWKIHQYILQKQQMLSGRDEMPEDLQPTGFWFGQWLKAEEGSQWQWQNHPGNLKIKWGENLPDT